VLGVLSFSAVVAVLRVFL